MSKVLVDRELLEQLLDEGPRSVTWAAQEQARAILAKPEEVDGASIPLTGEYHIDCSYLMNLVDGQRAALSAVTAERDRLREQCELNDLVHGTKGRERVAALLAQNKELRKDAAAGAVVWKFIDRMGDPAECDPAEDILAEFVAAFDAAMAAKEA